MESNLRLEEERCARLNGVNLMTDEFVDPNVMNLFNTSVIKRFIDKLKISDTGCIEWTGALSEWGYGQISVGTRETQKKIPAHRWALQFALGGLVLPSDIKACHHCDNPACVNPIHLFPGTHQDNMDDMVRKGRSAISLGNAKTTPELVIEIRNSSEPGNIIAKRLNLAESTISEIRNLNTWKHVKVSSTEVA